MKHVLVPGGAGYIGSHTVYELVRRGVDVVVADNLETGHREAVHPKARFYLGDIRDARFLDELFKKEDIGGVIHFAANSTVGESMKDPLKYYDNNVNGTRVLLDAMLRHGVKQIVFSSTAATYGEPERIPIEEDDRTRPTNTYGETKLAMERMMHWAQLAHGLSYVSLRYFNACGAHANGAIGEAHDPETHLMPIILQTALGKRETVEIFGDDYDTPDGTCIRDYIHVCDLADAHIRAINYLAEGGVSTICNLGNGVGYSVKEVLCAVERVLGREVPKRIAARRAGDPARLVASGARAKALLGWQPEFGGLDDMAASAWAWHKAHPEGFRSKGFLSEDFISEGFRSEGFRS